MKAHRHAWIPCSHDGKPCGMNRCTYCGRKARPAYRLTADDIETLSAFDEDGTPMEETK